MILSILSNGIGRKKGFVLSWALFRSFLTKWWFQLCHTFKCRLAIADSWLAQEISVVAELPVTEPWFLICLQVSPHHSRNPWMFSNALFPLQKSIFCSLRCSILCLNGYTTGCFVTISNNYVAYEYKRELHKSSVLWREVHKLSLELSLPRDFSMTEKLHIVSFHFSYV